MSLILRGTKGSRLTISEMDGNFTYLDTKSGTGTSSYIPYFDDNHNLTGDSLFTRDINGNTDIKKGTTNSFGLHIGSDFANDSDWVVLSMTNSSGLAVIGAISYDNVGGTGPGIGLVHTDQDSTTITLMELKFDDNNRSSFLIDRREQVGTSSNGIISMSHSGNSITWDSDSSDTITDIIMQGDNIFGFTLKGSALGRFDSSNDQAAMVGTVDFNSLLGSNAAVLIFTDKASGIDSGVYTTIGGVSIGYGGNATFSNTILITASNIDIKYDKDKNDNIVDSITLGDDLLGLGVMGTMIQRIDGVGTSRIVIADTTSIGGTALSISMSVDDGYGMASGLTFKPNSSDLLCSNESEEIESGVQLSLTETKVFYNTATSSVSINMRVEMVEIGDIDNYNNSTKIIIDDNSKSVSLGILGVSPSNTNLTLNDTTHITSLITSSFSMNGSYGINATYSTGDGRIVTITNGIITNLA